MRKTFYIIFAISLFQQFTVGQWVQQTSGVTSSLLDIDFIDGNTGWTCGDGGVVLKTTNGGVNWVAQNTGVLKRLEGIDAVDANNLYCVGWFQTIIKSTNGGANWIIIRDGPSGMGSTFFKTFFLNTNTGWLLRSGTSGGYILRTTNGGITFDSTNVVFSFLRDIYFKDALTGVLCGDGALIMKTSNGGLSWNQIILPWGTELPNFYRMSFQGNTGWTIGNSTNLANAGPKIFKTTDFGVTWDTIGRVPYPNLQENYAVFFTNLLTGYAGGTTGYIYKSTNGGLNWYQQNSPNNGFRNDFWFSNDSIGWCTGGGGQIFKTSNGGTFVGIENITSEIPFEHNLQNIFPNPFNPTANIIFDIAYDDHVRVSVFDILGKEIEVLLNKEMKAGSYKLVFKALNLSSGIYICKLVSSNFQVSKKMVLSK